MFNIGSFNVRGLNLKDNNKLQLSNLVSDCINYKINILAVQETKNQSTKLDLDIQNHRVIIFETERKYLGLGFIISPTFISKIHSHYKVGDRICVLVLKDLPINIQPRNKNKLCAIINIHAPHSKRPTRETEDFYEQLEGVVQSLRHHYTFICGDFNAQVGKQPIPVSNNHSVSHIEIDLESENCFGNYTTGKRTLLGNTLIEFCTHNDLYISNTSFKHKSAHITTHQLQIIRKKCTTNPTVSTYFSQIDYICIPKHLKSTLQDSRSFAGTLTYSDHRLVISKFKLDKQRYVRKLNHNPAKKLDFSKLKFNETARRFNESYCSLNIENSSESLSSIINNLLTAANQTLPEVPKHRKLFCPIIQELSDKQKKIRLEISNSTNPETILSKRRERNKLLKDIKKQQKDNTNSEIDKLAEEINTTSDSQRMYKAAELIFKRKQKNTITVHNKNGHIVDNNKEKIQILTRYYNDKYKGNYNIQPFTENSALINPITPEEIQKAINKLNCGKAVGPENIPAESLKAASHTICPQLANIFNKAFENKEDLDINSGKLILLQKPGKPVGPVANLRPIVLLSIFRKVLSLVTLARIRDKIELYLSASQAGFRPNRSTTDIVLAHKLLIARVLKYKESFTVLGIDLSSAFDTIDREKLLSILQDIVDPDELNLIRFLLANTTLKLSSGNEESEVKTIIGTPQGDSLSPLLFIIYFETALKELRPKLNTSIKFQPCELIYADDCDLIFDTLQAAKDSVPIIVDTLGEWNLKVNAGKTEFTTVCRDTTEWHKTRKLGSLLNDEEDIIRRKQLAAAAFKNMQSIWVRRHKIINQDRLLKLYNSLVLPILTYNSST